MSLLPGQILPQTEPLGRVTSDGLVIIDKNWWLLIYNLCVQVLASGSGIPADALIDLESADMDAIDSDALALRQPISNLGIQTGTENLPLSSADLPDITKALLLAQDSLLPDPIAAAQPITGITVGASPFTFTAPSFGSVAVSGGTVSTIVITRGTININTGVTAGVIPVSRYDQVKVSYTAAPGMAFIPGSSQ